MMTKAFCPGHVTGFFEMCPSPDPLKAGSRGAGICISLGARAEVELCENERKAIVNEKMRGEVTEIAMKKMLGDKGAMAKISLSLSISQGFGMSAAGTLATTLALASLTHISRKEAIKAAHSAEIKCSTGLGDVVTAARGGIEMRMGSGINGEIRKIEGEGEIVLAVLGKTMKTREMLHNEKLRERISEGGKKCIEALLADPTLENFFSLSKKFAEETGLMKKELKKVVEAASEYGMVSMCMLGNSVFAMGNTEELVKILSEYGKVYTCKIDKKGARLL